MWALTEDAAKELTTNYDRFEEKNTIFARYRFNEKVQGANETLEQFATISVSLDFQRRLREKTRLSSLRPGSLKSCTLKLNQVE